MSLPILVRPAPRAAAEDPAPQSGVAARRAKLITRVRRLLAKAASTDHAHERATFAAHAVALVRKHDITDAELALPTATTSEERGADRPPTPMPKPSAPFGWFDTDTDTDEYDAGPVCRSEDCEDDPRGGEGWEGYCGNCADRLFAEEEDDESEDGHPGGDQAGDSSDPADERCARPGEKWWHKLMRRVTPKRWRKTARRDAGTSSTGDQAHATAPVFAWPAATTDDRKTAGRRTDDRPRSYSGMIEWDLELYDSPREAAEALWRYVRISTGPVVDLIADDGTLLRVDLALAPGEGDVRLIHTP